MVDLKRDEGAKKMTQDAMQMELNKSQSEVVKDAIRQLAFKYKVKDANIDRTRKVMARASKQSGQSLSQAVMEMRDEV